MLCGDHYGSPYDLLAAALDVRGDRLRGIVARWRHAGYAETGTLGPGPAWCWLTPAGMKATGLAYPATRPALGRLAHIRAVLAIRVWLQAGDVYTGGRAWCSERRIRAAIGGRVGTAHVPDAEVHWPSLDGSPYAGQVWAIEAELTPKPLARTVTIMRGLLARANDYGPSAVAPREPDTAAALALRLKQIDTALDSYVIDLGKLSADPADTAARAMRDRIHTQFAHQHHEREAIEAQLKALTSSTPRTDDTDLLDELPELPGRLDELPGRIQAQLFAAFDIQVLWNAPMNQATFFAITDTTPAIITELLTRAGNDPASTATSPAPDISTSTAPATTPAPATSTNPVAGLTRLPICGKPTPITRH